MCTGQASVFYKYDALNGFQRIISTIVENKSESTFVHVIEGKQFQLQG
jgi:hypothetical protein